ncbi:MAG: ATP-grasp domain-containing protein [Butyricicoccus sp.]
MKEKLLCMGVDTTTRFALSYAKEIGVYTIVTDYNPIDSSPEKAMADEQWEIDVADLDALEARCRKEQVTGIYAGNHEFCLDMTKELCARLGLPFYASDEGWACARDKKRFKQHCIACGLDVPKTYPLTKPFQPEILAEIRYPVIVKPTDACAQKGLSLCRNEEELRAGYDLALGFSDSGTILVEEWVEGEEISMDYLFIDGKPLLIGLNQAIFMEINHRRNFTLFCQPGKQYDDYKEQTTEKVEKLFQRMNWKNGVAFLQAICSNGTYYFIEMGGRLDGVGSWVNEKAITGKSRVEHMVDCALGRERNITWNPHFSEYKKCSTIYLLWARSGKIDRIIGEEEICSMPGVQITLKRFAEGGEIEQTDNMLQIAYYIAVVADNWEQLMQMIQTINGTLHIYNEQGEELLLPFTEYSRLIEAGRKFL